MYRIYLNNGDELGDRVLYYPGDDEYIIGNAVVKLAVGQAGSCEFLLPPINPLYDSIQNRKSMVTVYRDTEMIFCGEVRESDKDNNNCKKIYAVGELSFLADTIQLPHRYTASAATPSAFLTSVIANHNGQVPDEPRKQFTARATFSPTYDESDKVTDYTDTLTAIRENLGDLGGLLKVTRSGNTKYLDYLDISNYGNTNTQGINFGENLLDYAENKTSSDLVTVVIPLGARLDEDGDGFEKRVDITSKNGGLNYLTASNTFLGKYGHIWKVVIFDGITDPQTLKNAGQAWLNDNLSETITLKVTAVDLAQMDTSLDAMSLGDLVPCYAEPYGMNTSMYIQEMTLNLMEPQKDTITMSATYKNKVRQSISSRVATGESKIRQEAAKQELKIRNVIRQEMANIMAKFAGTQGGYKLVEFDEQTGLWLKDLYMNAPSKTQATRILEISMNGIRMYNGTAGGYTDPTKWKTAWDFDGGFCADFILTGTLMAGLIKAGILSDVQGKNSWNLETGLFETNDAVIRGTFQTKNISAQSADGLSISANGSEITGYRYGEEISWIDMSSSVIGTNDTGLQIGGKGIQIMGKLYTTTNPNNPYDVQSGVLGTYSGNLTIAGDTFVFYNGLLCYKI